uniref:Uncharacterized protein n=1 Tax=Manihot esculenta TaxID=3983 RepID=A0A2C9WAF9_MANES
MCINIEFYITSVGQDLFAIDDFKAGTMSGRVSPARRREGSVMRCWWLWLVAMLGGCCCRHSSWLLLALLLQPSRTRCLYLFFHFLFLGKRLLFAGPLRYPISGQRIYRVTGPAKMLP